MYTLRPYQEKSIALSRKSFAKGNKEICLCLATGSGKSIIARKIVEAFREKSPNGKIAYLTFRNVLINQMKDTLKGLNVEIDTLQAKGKNPTEMYNLVLIDEAHYAKNSKLQNNINSKYKLSLTATPITSDGYALDFDEIIDVVQLADLIKRVINNKIQLLRCYNFINFLLLVFSPEIKLIKYTPEVNAEISICLAFAFNFSVFTKVPKTL